MTPQAEWAIKQLAELIQAYSDAQMSYYRATNDKETVVKEMYGKKLQYAVDALNARTYAAVERLTNNEGPFAEIIEGILAMQIPPLEKVARLVPALEALRAEYEGGYMQSFAEIIHGDLFGDFLDMADHYHERSHEVAAAVIAGTVLEEHLRKLAVKHSVLLVDANGKPRLAEPLNHELAKAGAYTVSVQKQVTAWYGVRNTAAHGQLEPKDYGLVGPMVTGVRSFVNFNPA